MACLHTCSVVSNSLWPHDCGLPGSSVHEVFQARMLECVSTSSSKGSSWPRDGSHVSCKSPTLQRVLYCWATREPLCFHKCSMSCIQNYTVTQNSFTVLRSTCNPPCQSSFFTQLPREHRSTSVPMVVLFLDCHLVEIVQDTVFYNYVKFKNKIKLKK